MSDGDPGDGRGFVVFLHGWGVHSSSWLPWSELFDDSGYDSAITRWPGEFSSVQECRADPAGLRRVTVSRISAAVDACLTLAPKRSILIGHGLGGRVAQVLLDRADVSAVIAITPTVGCTPSGARTRAGWLRHGLASATTASDAGAERFHHWYANRVDREASDRLHDRYAIPAPVRLVLSGAGRNRRPGSESRLTSRSPLLLLSAGGDRIIPERAVLAEEVRHRRWFPDAVSDYHAFPGRGHSLTVDQGWPDVANYCLDWLSSQDL